MKNKLVLCLFLIQVSFIFSGCKSTKDVSGNYNVQHALQDYETFKIEQYSDDPSYGYSEGNPVKVGGISNNQGPLNERRFLNALMGPNGEPITYSRIGSCCKFKTKNGLLDNAGFLDKYEIAYKGLKEPIILYINMYDSDRLRIPVGFKKKIY